jgi:quercetin dioxygenase-like cupin family protein
LDKELLGLLQKITPEERATLDGRTTIDRDIYMQGRSNTVNAGKLLAAGKLITVRPHTRFIHFPEHTHDYVEAVYMCTGQTTHIVNGKKINLQTGELLFMNQRATHEILEATEEDVAVNFIVLPQFFNTVLPLIGEDETPLRRFLADCLCSQSSEAGFLHFKVAEVKPIQNLVENLLFILLRDTSNKRKMSQLTMALLFMQIMDHTGNLSRLEGEMLGGARTCKALGRGTRVDAPLLIEDGIRLLVQPCVSPHAPGCLILTVDEQLTFLGDLPYAQPGKGSGEMTGMLRTLQGVKTEAFVLSHGETFRAIPKAELLESLSKKLL